MKHSPEKPVIEFPCADYPVKVIGVSSPKFREFVLEVIKKHDSGHDGQADIKKSRQGTFEAVNVKINATGVEQIEALYQELKANNHVKIVL